jgi:hypothetical protein
VFFSELIFIKKSRARIMKAATATQLTIEVGRLTLSRPSPLPLALSVVLSTACPTKPPLYTHRLLSGRLPRTSSTSPPVYSSAWKPTNWRCSKTYHACHSVRNSAVRGAIKRRKALTGQIESYGDCNGPPKGAGRAGRRRVGGSGGGVLRQRGGDQVDQKY